MADLPDHVRQITINQTVSGAAAVDAFSLADDTLKKALVDASRRIKALAGILPGLQVLEQSPLDRSVAAGATYDPLTLTGAGYLMSAELLSDHFVDMSQGIVVDGEAFGVTDAQSDTQDGFDRLAGIWMSQWVNVDSYTQRMGKIFFFETPIYFASTVKARFTNGGSVARTARYSNLSYFPDGTVTETQTP